MIIVMQAEADQEQIQEVEAQLSRMGYVPHRIKGVIQTVIGAVGDPKVIVPASLERFSGVEKILSVTAPYKLVSRQVKTENSVIQAGGVEIGGKTLCVMAGPCAIENWDNLITVARRVKQYGANILRGGAFKPRTSPYSFQGLEHEGLKLLARAREETGLAVVTEVLTPHEVELVARYADIIQVGARNMQNYSLLREVGRCGKPVLLKRGMAATVEEWLMAAEYILAEKNYQVILCERGIRTFENSTRSTLDISSVPQIKQVSHLPVIVDPSHSGGNWRLVLPLSLAAIASGADGLMIEVHHNPAEAFCDGAQSLTPDNFAHLMSESVRVAAAVGRCLPAADEIDKERLA